MVTLDAYALIAFLRDEPAADDVSALLADATALSATNYAEVVDHLIRIVGLDDDEAAVRMQLLIGTGMRVIPVDESIAGRAGELRARHYRRGVSDVSLADCTALATSLSLGAPLATSDPALAQAARAEGCAVVALPDMRGDRP